MPTNKWFNNYRDHTEQDLHADLVSEYIQIHGLDVYYIPRTDSNVDYLMGEDPNKTYNNAYKIECYPENYESWGGAGETITNFGFEVQDQWKIIISRRRYEQIVIPHLPDGVFKPRDGDLIAGAFSPGRIWEIKWVPDEAENDFFQFGKKYTWEVSLELWQYNQEELNTGVSPIDIIETALKIDNEQLLDNIGPEQADNKNMESEGFNFGIIDFSEESPFGSTLEKTLVLNYLEMSELQALNLTAGDALDLAAER
jgi:hypothetical protein